MPPSAAGELLDVVRRILQFIGQRKARLKQLGSEELHQPGQLVAQMLGAQIVLALAAGSQVQHDLFVQREVGQRFPRQGTDAAADHGVFPGALLAADPDGIVVGVSRRGVPLDLLRRGRDAAAPAGGNAEAAVGAGVPVLDEIGPGEDLIAVGTDVLAGSAGGAVGVQVPALAAVDLRVGRLHQGVHGVSGKDTHARITPFRRCPPPKSPRRCPAKSAVLSWQQGRRPRNPQSAPCGSQSPGCPAKRTGGGIRR